MATIGEVARYAGVSRSTVSHALSGKRPISEETKRRVADAVAALNYTANAGARALATARTRTLGLVVPFTPQEFEPATMQYVLVATQTARSLDYDVLLVTDEEGAAGIARITSSNLVDGVIILDAERHDPRIPQLREAGRPAVIVGAPAGAEIDSVDLGFEDAGALLVEHLYALGHRKVVFLTLPEVLFEQDLGYAWRFRDAVIETAERLEMALVVFAADEDPDRRSEGIVEILDANADATALLVHNDGALVELPRLLEDRGIRIPDDLSVVSIFPASFGRTFHLPYTAIETAAAAVAERAVRMLSARIDDPDAPVVNELLVPVLVDRGSSRAV